MPEVSPSTSYFNASKYATSLFRPTRYEFYIPQLPSLGTPGGGSFFGLQNPTDFRQEMQFSTENVFFPSRNISSEPIKVAGPVEEIPYEATYGQDLDVTLRVSEGFRERLIFETWMNTVQNLKTQNLNYPKNYRCEAYIIGMNINNEKTYEVKLTDVWPKSIGRVNVSQGSFNSIATMPIQLAFRRYFVTYANDITLLGDIYNEGENGKFIRKMIE